MLKQCPEPRISVIALCRQRHRAVTEQTEHRPGLCERQHATRGFESHGALPDGRITRFNDQFAVLAGSLIRHAQTTSQPTRGGYRRTVDHRQCEW